jgi:DNA-binding MarR family transcriptional regulator
VTENERSPVASLQELDDCFEHRARLAIAVLLAEHGELSFARFKEWLGMTDGNLGAQLRKLEDSGYLRLKREFVARKPATFYSLTVAGRRALERHLGALQELIGRAR